MFLSILFTPLYSQINNEYKWDTNILKKDSITDIYNSSNKNTKSKTKYFLKTSSIKDIDSYFPKSSLPRIKIKALKFASNTIVSIYMKEFINKEWKKSEYDLIEKSQYNVKNSFSVEIVADTANAEQLIIYTLLPGSITLRYKKINNDNRFRAIPFKMKSTINEEVPLLFLYENKKNSNTEHYINSYLENDSLDVIFNKDKMPFSEINRYIIIYYSCEYENN